MTKSSSKNKEKKGRFDRGNWLTTVPLVAVGVAWLYFWFLPQGQAIQALRDDLEAQRRIAGEAASLTAQVETVSGRAAQTREFVDAWRQNAPADGRVSELFGDINRSVHLAGGQTAAFNPKPHAPMAHLRKIPLEVAILGRFPTAFETLRAIEQLPATVWIESLTIESPRREGEPVRSEASLVIFSENSDSSD